MPMLRITLKVKIAAGIAAGALTLGAAGAYAAANAHNTIPVTSPTPVTLGSGTNVLKVVTFNDGTLAAAPANGFKDAGQCVSWLATNKNVALASTLGSSTTLPKNYHGKLMSAANAWCKTQLTMTAKTDNSTTEKPAAAATDSIDATAAHGRGHVKHASDANQ